MVFRALAVFIGIACCGPTVSAAETTGSCAASYEKGQEERADGHLKAALGQLKACADPSCPKFIRDDCFRWMADAEAALPSAVFAVRKDGNDLTEVDITCDGVLLARSLDGKAIDLDPGVHSFVFSIAGGAPIEKRLVIREGERGRMVDVDFRTSTGEVRTPASGARSLALTESNSRKSWAYGLAGVGALGLAGFVTFALLGHDQESDLKDSCSPYCSTEQVSHVRGKYLVADASLGVGLISLGVATYLLLSKGPGEATQPTPKSSPDFSVRTTARGGLLQLSTAF